ARPAFGEQLGVFALQPIRQGELLGLFGGDIMTADQLTQVADDIRPLSIQVEEDLYLVSLDPSPGDRFNHCCDPNAGVEGHIAIVALRDIKAGEHICFDYAMSDGSEYDEFECQCGSPLCRGRVTGNDWQIPELQERYKGHFMPYLQRRIEAAKRVKSNGHKR
ncbi:MAG: SET domain-containing protein, partial [Candidatus Competibacteraceae bacterium]|nr:SET domain-containing protein [Candidatus Competibacteraceae bacterium]